MLATVIISIFVFFIVLIIFLEYRNEKKYQEKRRQSRDIQTRNRRTPTSQAPQKAPPKVEPAVKPKPTPTVEVKPEPKPEPEVKPKPEPIVEVKPQPKPEPKPEIKVEPKPEPKAEIPKEEVKEAKELPEANYPPFTHVRLVEMGLSDDEAKEFVGELIPQLEEQIPLIEEAMNSADFHQMERLTHGIKGSATNIGTGGVSDLLVDCNTYLKTGTDIDVVKAYFEHLKHYTQELKEQYA